MPGGSGSIGQQAGSADADPWVVGARALGVDQVLVVRAGDDAMSSAGSSQQTNSGVVRVDIGADPVDQHRHPFPFVGLDTDGRAPHERLRAALHQASQHLAPGGVLGVPRRAAERVVAKPLPG